MNAALLAKKAITAYLVAKKITKQLLPTASLAVVIFFTTITSSFAASHRSCDAYQHRIDRLQSLNTRGGKAKQLDSRRKKINQYEDELYKCSNIKKIQIVTNRKKQKVKLGHEKMRPNSIKNTENPQNALLQQSIKTCNYWIEQNNKQPSWDNTNYRNTACRAADENETRHSPPAEQIPASVRKLKDCIKPNNLIDNDVSECMKGNIEAVWK